VITCELIKEVSPLKQGVSHDAVHHLHQLTMFSVDERVSEVFVPGEPGHGERLAENMGLTWRACADDEFT
jgi:hypothetical protein